MKTVRFLLALCLSSLGNVGASRGIDEVAHFGCPPRLEIRGARSFEEAEIRRRLLADVDVANACNPAASTAELCRVLTAKAVEGYRDAGFADVVVRTAPHCDRDRLEITIVEGQKYLAGRIVVLGVQAIDAETLIADLTAGTLPINPGWASSRSRWVTGEVARFGRSSIDGFYKGIERRLLERGRVGAQFDVEVTPDREQAVATLVVTFTDEGRAAIVDEISITGNKKNSREDVLELIGVRPGTPFLGALDKDVEEKLFESGRFIKSKVRVIKPAKADEPVKLAIELEEYEKAPPLRQELSREETALARLGLWLHRFAESDDELVITLDDHGDIMQAVIAPRRGIIGILRLPEGKGSAAPFTLAFVMGDERIGFYSAPNKRKVEGHPPRGRVLGNIELSIHDGPPNLTGDGMLSFGVGFNPKGKTGSLFRFRFKDTPTSLLSLAHEYQSKLSWKDDTLAVAFRDQRLSVDAATGRLVEFGGSPDVMYGTMKPARGEFRRMLQEIDAASADYAPAQPTDAPLTAALTLYCDAALHFLTKKEDAANRNAMNLVRKLSLLGVAEPLDRIVMAVADAPDAKFFVPDDHVPEPFWKDNGTMNVPAIMYGLGRAGIQYADLLTPPTTWPWHLWREAMFALTSKSSHLEKELVNHLSAPDSGPLRHLIVGEWLRANQMRTMSRVFGLVGQLHLDTEAFRRDYSALLDRNAFIGHCLLTWAELLRQLDEAELQLLCKMLLGGGWLERSDAAQLARLARKLRHERQAPIEKALADALDAWWQAGLRNYVKQRLQALAAAPKRTPDSEQSIAVDNRWRYRWHQGQWWYYNQQGVWQYWTGQTWAPYRTATASRARRRR